MCFVLFGMTAHDINASRLRSACVRVGMMSLEQLPEAELRALPPSVQGQIRAIKGLRSASRSMGLGALAFEDAGEFIGT